MFSNPLVLFTVGFCAGAVHSLEVINGGVLPSERAEVGVFYDGDDSIYVFGGSTPYAGVFRDILLYNVSTGLIESVASFPFGHAGGGVGGDGSDGIYYTGGTGPLYGEKPSAIWKSTAANPQPLKVATIPLENQRSGHGLAADLAGSLYMIGGAHTTYYSYLSDILKFDTRSNSFQTVASLPHTLYGAGATWLGDSAYIFGGNSDPYTLSSAIYKFNPATNVVSLLSTHLPTGIVGISAVTVDSNTIYLVGGFTADNSAYNLLKFDLKGNTLENIVVDGLTDVFRTNAVYVPKLNRIYTFGGMLNPNKYTDQIQYIQL